MRVRGFCFVVLAAGLVAAACSSSAATYAPGMDYGGYGTDEKPAPTTAPVATEASAVGEVANPTAAGEPQSGGAEASGAVPVPSSDVPLPEDQIVKTGSIEIQVAGIDTSIARATDEMHGLGGWLAGSDRTTSDAEDMASATYRVPVNRFEDALAAMRVLGSKVLAEHTESTPVGGQIVDLQARIDNLRASEKAIQAIMAKANTIGDVLTVQERLADVQGQIEELSGQLAGLTDQSAYSTLTVVFVVPILPTPSPSPTPTPSPSATATPVAWSAGDQAGQAAGTLGQVGESAATVLIWVAILVIPVGLAFVLLLALLGFAARTFEPYRRRLLPFTVAQPVTFAQPAWPAQSGAAPVQPAPGTPPSSAPEAQRRENPEA
jgi:Domain of unknown function (DUF4349)